MFVFKTAKYLLLAGIVAAPVSAAHADTPLPSYLVLREVRLELHRICHYDAAAFVGQDSPYMFYTMQDAKTGEIRELTKQEFVDKFTQDCERDLDRKHPVVRLYLPLPV